MEASDAFADVTSVHYLCISLGALFQGLDALHEATGILTSFISELAAANTEMAEVNRLSSFAGCLPSPPSFVLNDWVDVQGSKRMLEASFQNRTLLLSDFGRAGGSQTGTARFGDRQRDAQVCTICYRNRFTCSTVITSSMMWTS